MFLIIKSHDFFHLELQDVHKYFQELLVEKLCKVKNYTMFSNKDLNLVNQKKNKWTCQLDFGTAKSVKQPRDSYLESYWNMLPRRYAGSFKKME